MIHPAVWSQYTNVADRQDRQRSESIERTVLGKNVYCGQTAGWIKMPLGTEVGLGPGDIVLDGDPAPPNGAQPPIFG